MHSPLCTSHQRNAPSPPPLISTPPLGSHARAYVIPPRPLKMDSRCAPLQHHAIAPAFDVPEPGHLVKAATGQGAPIRAPGDRPHFVGMPCERLAHTPAFHIPQLDGPIKAPTGKSASIGGKGQCEHPGGMPCGLPHEDLWLHS